VLVLVADHHPEDEIAVRLVGQPVEGIQGGRPHGAAISPRPVRGQQRQVGAAGPRVHESVVEVVDGAGQHPRLIRVAAAQQPQFFLLPDVGQVPNQGTHQRVVLAAEFGVVEIHQPQSPFPRSLQITDQCFA
jgi:hypothetical protein